MDLGISKIRTKCVTSDGIIEDTRQEFARLVGLNHKNGQDQLPRSLNWTPERANECSKISHAGQWQVKGLSNLEVKFNERLNIRYPSDSLPNMETVQAQPVPPTPKRTPAENLIHSLKTGQPIDNPLFNAWTWGPKPSPAPHGQSLRERLNMLQKRGPAHCSTCCCLDAGSVSDDAQKSSWASQEYNVSDGITSQELFIKHTELVSSANGGCVFCGILSKSLSAIRPGWETQDSFIQLYLATGLPAVVRWTNGFRVTSEEEHLDERYEQIMDVQIHDSSGHIEPDVEFELYRPARSKPGALEYWVQHIGIAREPALHAGDIQSFRFISEQATACLRNHRCGSIKPWLPDRIIYINPDNSEEIRLVEPKSDRAQYIALSYCWGPTGPNTFLTNAATIADRKAGIKAADLPRLFIGIINCARMLGIAYIWIDRLCIIQGDDEDFAKQAPKMGEYYGNATLTISAASADSETDDILVERDAKWRSAIIVVELERLGSFELRFRQRPYPIGTMGQNEYYGKVSTRAWIWQERLLAARTVFFTPSALKFECRHHSIWEGYGEHTTGPSWSARLDKANYAKWLGLLEEFTHKKITRPSDRLPAISSVMKRISITHSAWTPLYGMWSQFLHTSLAWAVNCTGEDSGRHPCRVHPQYYAPSWSWASVDGPVLFGHCNQRFREDTALGIIDVDKETGVLTVLAHWSFVLIRCQVECPYTPSDVQYHYETTSILACHEDAPPDLPSVTGLPIAADVALDPVKRNLSLREDGTIVRLAHGRKPPRETWESKCLCIMVGQQTDTKATVLLLGESQRVPGAYERIGLANGWPAEMFTQEAQLDFKIA